MKKIAILMTFLTLGVFSCFAKTPKKIMHSTTFTSLNALKNSHNIEKIVKKNTIKSQENCIEIVTVRMTDNISFTVSASGATCEAAFNAASDLAYSVGEALTFLAQFIP